MSVSLPLPELLSGLADSLQSIDIRCAVKKYEPGWLSLLTAIRISARPLEPIRERYKELEHDGPGRNAEPFRILWQVYPIDQLERILTELSFAQLSVEGESVRFPQPVQPDKFQRRFEHTPDLVMPWDGSRWPATYYCSSENRTIPFSDAEITVAVRRSGWGSTEEMATHFLGVNHERIYSTSIPLFVSIEMPAKIEVRTSVNGIPEFLIHTQPNLSDFGLFLRTDRQRGKPITMPLESCGEEGIWSLHRSSLEPAKLEPDDIFSCTLSHRLVPVLDEIGGYLRNFLPIPYLNPLLVCLRQFWNMNAFSERLERAREKDSAKRHHNPQHVFQEAVAHMLTLAGFQTINLGEEEVIRASGTKVERATLDILAYYSGSKIMILGACTLTPPRTDDIRGVLETMAILRGNFPADAQVHFVPMIFSNQEQECENHDQVRILNARKIRKLRTLIETGHENQFVQSLQWPFQDVLDEP